MFKDDIEKMRDFTILSKDKFLEAYSYLKDSDYMDTVNSIDEEWIAFDETRDVHIFNMDNNIYCNWYEVVDGEIKTDIILEQYFIYKG